LRLTLQAIGQISVPDDIDAELIVVDNGPDEATSRVVSGIRIDTMRVRYVEERLAGKSYAYNRAIAESRGEILLFTDDDVRPVEGWIEGMCRPLVNGDADAVAGGVTIAPELRRAWLRGGMEAYVASTEHLPRNAERFELVGANMSCGRWVFARIPAFDPELGPGSPNGLGEETLFSRQLRAMGCILVSRHDVVAVHHFSDDRLEARKFLEGASSVGNANAYVDYHWGHASTHLGCIREYVLRAKLVLRRWLSSTDETPKPWEVVYYREIAYWGTLRRLAGAQRNYAKHGLVKLRGILPSLVNDRPRDEGACNER
jgi:glycosyltransferase involved in cell wall biosynthesis